MDSHLAPDTSAFIGRSTEIAALRALLAGDARLVTITGPGGIGKTRVAREIARAFANGNEQRKVRFCDLTEARDRGSIDSALRAALQIPPGETSGSEDSAAVLRAALACHGPALIVLDNFEQVIEHGPATIARWVAMAPDARFLVTSRECLRLSGEYVFDLPPLALPDSAETIETADAVQLILDRARRARPERAFEASDRAHLTEIARRLEGIPLAIELAATRLSALDPAALLARLERPLQLLARGPRDGAVRHRTLHATIEWSWDLLEPVERAALAQLSVFRGGFDFAAAEFVVDLADFTRAPSVLDVLTSLREKSMLWNHAGSDGSSRLGMYVAIHEFAAAQLATSGDEAAARARHARYFADLAGVLPEKTAALGRPGDAVQIAREHENLAVAAERALAASPADPAMRIDGLQALLALHALDSRTAASKSAREQIDRALTIADELPDAHLRIRLLAARGASRLKSRAPADGLRDLDDAVSLARAVGERRLEAWALHELGRGLIANERPRDGEAALGAAIRLLHELGDTEFELHVTAALGALLAEPPETEQSRATASAGFVVHPDGRWFELSPGERVVCARRPMLCAVLASLARARIESPGVPVTIDTLIAAAWPGERIARDHARNRLRVGIATLRKLGLRDLLQSVRGAYLFDADVPMRRARS